MTMTAVLPEMSDSMEMELAKMKEANSLTPEFEQQRQKIMSDLHSIC